MGLVRHAVTLFVVLALALAQAPHVLAARHKGKATGPSLIRDAEIEGLLRLMSRPIFKAAGINPLDVRVYVIADDRINAFVAGGQRIFIHTGLLTKTSSPNEVIGVLAHETGHIAGGHLAQLNSELARASTERIIGTLVGAAAMVGGAMSGNPNAAKAGQGVIFGSQGTAQRNFLSYQRSMEASADQAALKFLNATGQSPDGMLTLFNKLANDSLASLENADPYMFSHPMPFERIRNLELQARKSPHFMKGDDPAMVLRHELAKAKLAGYMNSTQRVFQRYPSTDKSMASRYARAIAMFRRGDIRNAMPLLDSLTAELPQNPYFWELKAQAYLDNAQADKAIAPIKRARALLPNNGLLQFLHAQILLGTQNPKLANEALALLRQAKKTESNMPGLYKYMAQAYALKGDISRAELATAEYAWLIGDKTLAVQKAKVAQEQFKHGTPEWLRANDLLTFAGNK